MDIDEKDKEILFLRDKVEQLQLQVAILQKRMKKRQRKPRHTLREKLLILWYIEAFQITRRKVTEYLGIARSTLYRWLHKTEDQKRSSTPANKTPVEIATLIWEIARANISWGRVRIANQLALLNIFISASTVRNILNRPKHRKAPVSATTLKKTEEKTEIQVAVFRVKSLTGQS